MRKEGIMVQAWTYDQLLKVRGSIAVRRGVASE